MALPGKPKAALPLNRSIGTGRCLWIRDRIDDLRAAMGSRHSTVKKPLMIGFLPMALAPSKKSSSYALRPACVDCLADERACHTLARVGGERFNKPAQRASPGSANSRSINPLKHSEAENVFKCVRIACGFCPKEGRSSPRRGHGDVINGRIVANALAR